MNDPQRIAAVIGIPLFAGVGVTLVIWAARRIWFSRRSFLWPRVIGVVIRSDVVEDNDEGRSYIPQVEYSYEVGGQTFRGDTLYFGFLTERYGDREEAQVRAARYPVGSPVTIAHHPAQPTRCVIEHRLDRDVYVMLALGLIFIVAGVWAFISTTWMM